MSSREGNTALRAVRARARWTDLAALGFVFAGLGPGLLFVALLAWDVDTGSQIGFFAALALLSIATAYVVRRFGRWGRRVGYAVGAFLLLALWWTTFYLFVGPGSFFEFMAGVLIMPGAITGLVCIALAGVAERSGRMDAPGGGEPKAIRIALTVVGAAALLSGLWTMASRTSVGDASEAAQVVVTKNFEFSPTRVDAAGGSKILLRNDDPFVHTFTVDAIGVDVHIAVRSEKLVEIPSVPGTYVLYCRPHTSDPEHPNDEDMAGILRVT